MTKSAKEDSGVLDSRAITRLCEVLEPIEPEPFRRSRMRERILRSTKNSPIKATRPDDGQWCGLLPGVSVKILRMDKLAGTQTALWKLDANARIPAHTHVLEEECMILQGDLEHAGAHYAAGDFLFTQPGGQHEEIHSPHGALLLIRGEHIGTHASQ